jgi:uncharacterized protein YecT (DUF1311 family)
MRQLIRYATASLFALGFSQVPCAAQHMNSPEAPCRGVAVTSDMTLCFDRAYKDADHDLNEVYGEVQAVLGPGERRDLGAAERAWLKYRDSTCAAERNLYEGGTAVGPAYLACLEEETRLRARDLRATYGWRIEKARR